MTRLAPRVSKVRALRNMNLLRQPVPGGPGSAPAAAGAATRQIAPELVGLLAGAEDPVIDRLRREGAKPALDPAPETAGDLLGRPALGKPVDDIAGKHRVAFKQSGTLAAEPIGAVCDPRAIGATVERIAPQLAADGRWSPPEGPGNRPKAQPGGFQIGDPIPFG